MIIETWILVVIVLFLGISGIVSLCGWMAACARNEDLQRRYEFEKGNVNELKWLLAKARAKNNVKVASEFHEGKNE